MNLHNILPQHRLVREQGLWNLRQVFCVEAGTGGPVSTLVTSLGAAVGSMLGEEVLLLGVGTTEGIGGEVTF